MRPDKVYTIPEISDMVDPLAKKRGFESAFLFGSYARGEAEPDSDIDLLIEAGGPFRALSL